MERSALIEAIKIDNRIQRLTQALQEALEATQWISTGKPTLSLIPLSEPAFHRIRDWAIEDLQSQLAEAQAQLKNL